jgi:hypothetical protein
MSEWSLILADLEPRVRQEVEAMADTIAFLKQALETTVQERDEARQLARELLDDAEPDHWDERRLGKMYPWLKEGES